MFLSEFKEKWADVDGVRTRYFDEGQGAPIVFIHGGQCGDASGVESAPGVKDVDKIAAFCTAARS